MKAISARQVKWNQCCKKECKEKARAPHANYCTLHAKNIRKKHPRNPMSLYGED